MPPRDGGVPRRPVKRPQKRPVRGAFGLTGVVNRATAVNTRTKPGPRTDVQTGGRNQLERAERFKRTPTYKRSVGAAKPARQSDVTSSGGDYGKARGKAFATKHRAEPYAGIYLLPSGGGVTRDQAFEMAGKAIRARKAAARAPRLAPVLTVLEQTTRPIHGIAGGADALVQGHGLGEALHRAGRGFANKDRTLFSDVLKHAGAPKIVQGVGGFALDVAADPTTYATFGVGSAAKKAAQDAALSASRKALKAGLSREQAARFGARAAAQTLRKHGEDKAAGAFLKFAGREFPGVRRATAKAAAPVARRAGATRPAKAVRSVASDVNPGIAPEGVPKAVHEQARQVTRTARSGTQRGIFRVREQAVALRKAIGPENYGKVIDALEANDLRSLPAELRKPAKWLRDQFKYTIRQQKRAGIHGSHELAIHDTRTAVPKVTADTTASRQALNAAVRERAVQERLHQESLAGFGVARGRAQILSRNVGGGRAESLAQALTVRHGERQFAGGGHGVEQAAASLRQGAENLSKARQAVTHAEAAHEATKQAARAQRLARARALKARQAHAGEAQGYFPHALDKSLKEGKGFQGAGARRITVDANRARAHRETLAELRKTEPGLFSEDLPLVFANRLAATTRAVNKAELNRRLADLGRPARAGERIAEHEQVFQLHGADLKPVDRLPARATRGRYVVLDKRLVEHAHSRLEAVRHSGILRGYDRVQGGFKRVATATPGFHIRNVVGDTFNAYLGQPGHQLAINLRHAGRVISRMSRAESKLPKDLHPHHAPSTKGVRIGGRTVSYDELGREAEKVGAIRQGFIARELEELSGKDRNIRVVRGHGGRQAAKRWMQNREDLLRLTTYIAARKRGLDPEAASSAVAAKHFDYSDLTPFERNVARRALPFWTWSARNVPLQAKSLVSRPGKYAQFQKLREELAGAVGLPAGYEANLSEYDQRQAGLPAKVAGVPTSLGLSLPLTDLNEIPTTLSPKALGREYAQRFTSLITPLLKDPVELGTNYSFFFRRAIENKDAPLVPAPAWVQYIPAGQRKKLGIVSDYIDKRSGKKTWAWPGQVAYVARAVPGLPNLAQNLTTTGSRVNQTEAQKALGVAGVRAAPLDKTAVLQSALNAAYKGLDKANRARAILNQRGIHAENATPEYRRVSERIKKLNAAVDALKTRRGDKVIRGHRAGTDKLPAGVTQGEVDAIKRQAAAQRGKLPPGVTQSELDELKRAAAGR